ncbi:hypothetical protein [Paraburkholderia sp. WSM4175]|uniref:hypothetical protein n=1 Tax=Paraburkholderia sp. WSM4175 TaxID=2991072 RepID=UPI003D24EB8D
MTREPVHERGRVIGHNITYPPFYVTVRDARGYESLIQAQPGRTVFEPVTRRRGMFDED